MKKLFYKSGNRIDERFSHDVTRLVKACEVNGYEISRADAAAAWRGYSDDEHCAGWIMIEGLECGYIFEGIRSQCDETEQGE